MDDETGVQEEDSEERDRDSLEPGPSTKRPRVRVVLQEQVPKLSRYSFFHSTVWYVTVQYGMLQYSMIPYSTV